MKVKREGNTLSVLGYAMSDSPETASVQVLRYRPLSTVEVLRGGDAGRTVPYPNGVTGLQIVTQWDMSEPLSVNVDLTGDLPAVVIVQGDRNGPIKAVLKVD